VIHAREENPPPNAKAVEWFLLTTIHITAAEDAAQCLRWYCLRWRIEDRHRALKSGCRIEDLAHETAERLRRAAAINLVIAWPIMSMTLLGRQTPELPAGVLFPDIELRALRAFAKRRLNPPLLLGEAVALVAKIGGYLGRNSAPTRPSTPLAGICRVSAHLPRLRVEGGWRMNTTARLHFWVKGRARP
jgi:hypothetical protein